MMPLGGVSCRQALFKAIIAADLPEGLTAVRLDVYPSQLTLDVGVSVDNS